MYRQSSRRSYGKKSSFNRAEKRDARTNMVTYKYITRQTLTQVLGLASYTVNPVHEFVNNDSRYASFIKTCNEWRVAKAAIRIMPLKFDVADLLVNQGLLIASCSDRQADYKASSSTIVPFNTIMSVSDSKVKTIWMGNDMNTMGQLTRGANQTSYIMSGTPPPGSPNGTSHFTPEFKFTFVNQDTASVGEIEVFIEVMMIIETRGARFMNTV